MPTVQQVMDRGRKPLNDADKVRYPDSDLLDYVNDGVAEIYELRPDLRVGKFGQPIAVLAATDTFPLSAAHAVAIQHYIAFRAETRDDENVNENREVKSYKLFQTLVSST
ncbi:hypothetical protein BKK79_00990 [Cupriavidus sp. USMAA2-4]|nr:hypothetical protein BKK79_00990 [Cupriavidus sp. USMAA2-4]